MIGDLFPDIYSKYLIHLYPGLLKNKQQLQCHHVQLSILHSHLQEILNDIGIILDSPIKMFEDNQSTIKIAEAPREHKRLKHIDIKYHYIRDLVIEMKIELE